MIEDKIKEAWKKLVVDKTIGSTETGGYPSFLRTIRSDRGLLNFVDIVDQKLTMSKTTSEAADKALAALRAESYRR